MAQQYNINDPYDLDIMRANYDNYSEEDWQAFIDFTQLPENKRVFSFEDRGCLMRMAKKAGQYHRPADKDIRWGLGLADKIERLLEQADANEDAEETLEHDNKIKARHVTFRVAWHDNKWDGSICKEPIKNRYCSGFHSLLSERLRKRKEKNLEQELAFKGQPIIEEYVPPCFWSVNLFGTQNLTVKHDNPADPGLTLIDEELPAQSIFSWPFAVSFTRTKEQERADGAYPKNLESVRIPKFNNAVRKGQSVAFMYAKFSNPLTEEDQQYLIVGCGMVTDKGDYHYFGPKDLIDKKKASKPKYRNFPSMNWAIRYSFQEPELLQIPFYPDPSFRNKLTPVPRS